MTTEGKPLFALTTSEFMEMLRQMIKKAIDELAGEKFQTTHQSEDTLNISQCAEFLKCSKMSIHNYKKKGLPFYKMGKTVLFKKDEVLAFMKNFSGATKLWKTKQQRRNTI